MALPPKTRIAWTAAALAAVVAAATAAEYDPADRTTGDCVIYVRVGGEVLPAARIVASDLTAGAAVGFAPRSGRVQLSISGPADTAADVADDAGDAAPFAKGAASRNRAEPGPGGITIRPESGADRGPHAGRERWQPDSKGEIR
ncbi:MAG: hypothetical protein AAFV86_02805 [Pseudomonadota bacterium]